MVRIYTVDMVPSAKIYDYVYVITSSIRWT